MRLLLPGAGLFVRLVARLHSALIVGCLAASPGLHLFVQVLCLLIQQAFGLQKQGTGQVILPSSAECTKQCKLLARTVIKGSAAAGPLTCQWG